MGLKGTRPGFLVMKKIITVLCTLLGVLIFFTGFQEAARIQKNLIYNPDFQLARDQESVVFMDLNLSSEQDAKDLQTSLKEALEETESAGFWQAYTQTTAGNLLMRNFICTPAEERVVDYPAITAGSVSSDSPDYYLSSDPASEQATDILDFTDSRMHESYQNIYEYLPLDSDLLWQTYEDEAFLKNALTLYSSSPTSLIQALQSSEAVSILGEPMVMEYTRPEQAVMAEEQTLKTLVVVCALTILLSFLVLAVRNEKEIVICKMNGLKNSRILKRIYGSLSLESLAGFCAGFLVSYLIVVGNFRPANSMLLEYFAKSLLIFCAGLAAVLLAAYFMIRQIKGTIRIKNSQHAAFFHTTLVKTCFFIVMIPLTVTSVITAVSGISDRNALYRGKEKIEEAAFVGLTFGFPDPDEELEMIRQMEADLDTEMHMESLTYLTDDPQNSLQFGGWQFQKPVTILKVDSNWPGLKSVQTKEDIAEDNEYLIIPDGVEYKDAHDENVTLIPAVNASSEMEFSLNNARNGSDVMISDPIILVEPLSFSGWTAGTSHYTELSDTLTREDLVAYGKSTGLPFLWVFGKDVWQSVMDQTNDTLMESGLMCLLIFMTLLICQYSLLYIFFNGNKNELSVQTLLGYPWQRKYSRLLAAELVCMLAAWLVIAWLYDLSFVSSVICLTCFVGMDLIFAWLFARYFERKKIVPILKGDEL